MEIHPSSAYIQRMQIPDNPPVFSLAEVTEDNRAERPQPKERTHVRNSN